ncbi:hypothetical protein [Marinoscillum sp. MHG1-6]|uniref:hypothetical protein n=1 Tax=Marinoscillum sp. MHG1-6 TaxID=2959627 RepID=UPI002157B392|nr:hypothetical protein [Marinoscillum sp. MHG1-6]
MQHLRLKDLLIKHSLLTALVFFVALGFTSCKDEENDGIKGMMTISYDFHNGQTVETAPYDGTHSSDFSADMVLEETDGGTLITVNLKNTVEGETYMIHAHDAADPASTPNGTPYNETPNSDVLVKMAMGNGGSVSVSQETTMSYEELTTMYDGFFVVHDPLQDISTTDISTYLVVGAFARAQTATSFAISTFDYTFNTGQLAETYAYAGSHVNTISASITVEELAGSQSRITVDIMNTLDGEMYATHAHDAADAASTPNGTPYNETPNSEVFVKMIAGNGGTATGSQISSMSHDEITATYEGFFVIHDPLQAIDTTDPTTYVILGSFAR